MTDAAREKIVERIRKLRAKAESEACTEAEAEVFARRVQEMVAEHSVTEGELDASLRAGEKPTSWCWEMRYACGWRRSLANDVGRLLGVVFTFGSGEAACWTGRRLSAEAAHEMYHHLETQVLRIAREMYPGQALQGMRRQAEKGLAAGVGMRLQRMRRESPPSLLPVVQEYDTILAGMDVRGVDTSPSLDSTASMNGLLHSERVQIRKEVSS